MLSRQAPGAMSTFSIGASDIADIGKAGEYILRVKYYFEEYEENFG